MTGGRRKAQGIGIDLRETYTRTVKERRHVRKRESPSQTTNQPTTARVELKFLSLREATATTRKENTPLVLLFSLPSLFHFFKAIITFVCFVVFHYLLLILCFVAIVMRDTIMHTTHARTHERTCNVHSSHCRHHRRRQRRTHK